MMARPLGMFHRIAWMACIVLLSSKVPCFGEDDPRAENQERVEQGRELLRRWQEIQILISKEKADWRVGKESLTDRIDIVKGEIEALRGKISEAKENISKTDEKRNELTEENESLRQAAATLEETLESLEERTRKLVAKLPAPLCERIEPLTQRLPDPEKETKLSLSDRFLNIVGILNEVNRFNREITVEKELRTLSDGTSAEVTVVYVGLGQAYYVNKNGTAAGVGSISEKGWSWTPANEAAAKIQEVVGILEKDKAHFVRLPIRVQ